MRQSKRFFLMYAVMATDKLSYPGENSVQHWYLSYAAHTWSSYNQSMRYSNPFWGVSSE